MLAFEHVHETARSTDEDVTTLAELLKVVLDSDTAVAADGAKLGTISKTTGLVEDLQSQLAGWADDDHKRLSTNFVLFGVVVRVASVHARSANLVYLTHQLGNDWDKEGGRLARSSLSDSNDILSSEDGGNGVALNGGGLIVLTLLDVVENNGVQAALLEL